MFPAVQETAAAGVGESGPAYRRRIADAEVGGELTKLDGAQ
jgi:hypothetical protein